MMSAVTKMTTQSYFRTNTNEHEHERTLQYTETIFNLELRPNRGRLPEKLWAREKEECAYLGTNLLSAVLPMKTKIKMADGETRAVIFQQASLITLCLPSILA